MNIDQKLDYYIARCDALDAEGIGALLKEIKAERVRLRDYLSPDQHAARICRAQNDAIPAAPAQEGDGKEGMR